MTKPTVSVITPTYNHERFIGQCIESVLGQSFPDWEMIIVDDESTDDTESIIQRYDDPRITYVRQAHVGPYRMAETYNRALDRARGDFIAILEGDDLWPNYKLERQLAVLLDHPEAVASYGRAGTINDRGEPLGLYPSPQIDMNRATTRDFVLRRSWVQPVSIILRRDPLSKIGGFHQDPRLPIVDLPTWLRLSLVGPFHFQPTVLGLWRQHHRQVTANYTMSRGAHEIAIDFYRELPPEQQREVGISEVEIRRVHRDFLAEEGWRATLQELSNGHWQEARQAVRDTLVNGSGFRRFEALLAFGCSLVHFDPTTIVSTLAATAPGRRVLVRQNPIAAHRRPELLAAALASEARTANDAGARPVSTGAEL